MPQLPTHIGPAEFGTLGAMVAVRCPKELSLMLHKAGGAWKTRHATTVAGRAQTDRAP